MGLNITNTNEELVNAMLASQEEQAEAGLNPVNVSGELRTVLENYVDNGANMRAGGILYNQLIANNADLANEFYTTMLNMITPHVNKVREYEDKFSVFHKDMKYGNTVEEIAVNLMDMHQYQPSNDGEETLQFKQELPDIRTAIHSINFQKYWKFTREDDELEKVFLDSNGFSSLLNACVTSMVNSAKFAEHEKAVETINDEFKKGNITAIEVGDPKTKEELEDLSEEILDVIQNFEEMSSDYNKADLTVHTPRKNVVCIVNGRTNAALVKKVLANAFNMDKAEIETRVIVLPKLTEKVPVLVYIFDEDALVVDRKPARTTTAFDAEHLSLNTMYHIKDRFYFSKFMNAVALTKTDVRDDSVTAVQVTSTGETVTKGQTLQMTATVTGDSANEVYWFVEGQGGTSTTYISESGLLNCWAKEKPGTKLTVTAYSKKNGLISGSKVVTVA